MKISTILRERIAAFCRGSSLHGLQYIGEIGSSTVEKLFWAICFFTSFGFSIYFIDTLFEKYNTNRVIVVINAHTIDSKAMPFPAVTICNLNRVDKTEALKIMVNGSEMEKEYIRHLCFANGTWENVNSDNETEKWTLQNLVNLILKISPSCNETLKACFYNGDELDCNNIFTTVLTDFGACCSFNQMPLDYILRRPINSTITKPRDLDMFQDWNFEVGYTENITTKPYPRILHGSGLSVVLDTKIHNYYCSLSNSVGYRLQLSNPDEIPRLELLGLNGAPGLETNIVVVPQVADSDKNLRSVPLLKRKCYFNDEKYLRFYRTYTKDNCLLDCQANYTMQRCGCLPYFYMTKTPLPTCSAEHISCIDDVLELVASNERPPHDKSLCKCFPSCFQLLYHKRFSHGRMIDSFNISSSVLKNVAVSYFVENMALLNIHFPGTASIRLTKNEIYGEVELMSNIGGLLAIFLGFSFLSATEVFYYLICDIIPAVLKTLYNNIKDRTRLFPFTK